MANDPLLGQTIGNYEIISRLGKGGMATVYRARQVNMQRDVAIKIMGEDLTEDPRFVARFEQEARVIANLQHPRILPVHDFGRQGDIFYLVMRLIEGESLYHRLFNGPLPFLTVSKYLTQIAEALDYAHSQSIIHRDLKPNNVLIDEWDNLYLMDFGLAKLIAASQNLTQTGAVLGTPAYMAPEQWRGEPVDGRTDVYSLGVILYEMVLGHPPFESDTPFTLMYKHLNDAPPSPRELMPDLPDEIEAVILKALAKDKDQRFAAAGDLAREFAALARVAGSLTIRERTEATARIEPSAPSATGDDAGESTGAGEVAAQTPSEAATAPLAAAAAAPAASDAAGEVAPPESSELPSAPDPTPAVFAASAAAALSEVHGVPDAANAANAANALADIPVPDSIAPPPPPIPLPAQQPRPDRPVPAPYHRPPPDSESDLASGVRELVSRVTSHPQIQRALEAVDHGVESAAERMVQATPAPKGDSSGDVLGGSVPTDAVPINAPAFHTLRGVVPTEDPILGVLDVRGTQQWQTWKNLLIGGALLFLFGAMTTVGFFAFIGILMLGYVGVEGYRTWRGDIGRFYLGFTGQRVVVLPRLSDGSPQFDRAWIAAWTQVERLRLTDRYVLLDVAAEESRKLRFGALLMDEAEGGLGFQSSWLPQSPIVGLIEDRGFETRNL